MIKVLITGGNGYISKSIYNFLYKIYNITSITRKDFDLEDTRAVNNWFKDKTFDIVIHAAIKGGSRLKIEDDSVKNSNLKMFNNLLFNKDKFRKLISFGSGAEFFLRDTPYGKSKTIINEKINSINDFYNLRIFGVFDENEKDTRFIKANILRYIKKEPMQILTNKVMDFIYMEDLINIVSYYLENDNLPKEINCCYEQKHTLKNIANMINQLDSHRTEINIQNKNILEFYCGESDLPIKTIGLEKGIENTFRKIKDQTL